MDKSEPFDRVLNNLEGSMILYGPPGCGKSTLLKWIARFLIENSQTSYLLPLFISLPQYILLKQKRENFTLLDFALYTCGIQEENQIMMGKKVLAHFWLSKLSVKNHRKK